MSYKQKRKKRKKKKSALKGALGLYLGLYAVEKGAPPLLSGIGEGADKLGGMF